MPSWILIVRLKTARAPRWIQVSLSSGIVDGVAAVVVPVQQLEVFLAPLLSARVT